MNPRFDSDSSPILAVLDGDAESNTWRYWTGTERQRRLRGATPPQYVCSNTSSPHPWWQSR
jgi:hypothetical protein